MTNHFPQEYFIRLHGLDPHFVGRITLYQGSNGVDVEIDIVQKDSGKIYNHVKSLYNQDEARESVDIAVQYLQDYLSSKSESFCDKIYLRKVQ